MMPGWIFTLLAVFIVTLGAGMARAQILDDYEESDGPGGYSVTVGDVLWWEEVEDGHVLPLMVITLREKAADELLLTSENHVGEEMAFYFDGKYITSFLIGDVLAEGEVRFRYDSEAQARLQPLLPVLRGEKPVVRIIRTR